MRKALHLATVLLATSSFQAVSQTGLQLTFGDKGIQKLAYNNTTFADTTLFPSDSFHIWHMRVTDLSGNVLPQYGWGETNLSESWNASTATETYTFPWGTVATQFQQAGNTLDLVVTETNNAGSGVLVDGAELYPVTLHFPEDPANFSGYTQYRITTREPGVSAADFGAGIVTAVIPSTSVTAPLYTGWKSAGAATYSPILTTTAPDGLATFFPSLNTPVVPGSSLTYTVSLRFTPEGTPADATDAYQSFARAYPSQMTWTDHRAIGTAYLASSPASTGDITEPGGFPTNPRRYFNDPTVDITTSAGLLAFQARILAQAAAEVTNAQALGAQGVITWDLEGEQYPQSTSYVCSPDKVGAIAPEMEFAILDPNSPYVGQKLDDAYFHILSAAGLRVGLCLRPQVFTLGADNTASQVTLSTNAAVISNLETKARAANSRWGATLFYVDSTVDANGGTLDPAIFQRLITDLPNFLFIPEESTARDYAYTAPFYSFLFHTDLGTPAAIHSIYPAAFGANLINDVAASTLATYQPELTASVQSGDILMGHVDYWQQNDPVIRELEQSAITPPPAPPTPKLTPTLAWSTPALMGYGNPLSAVQLNATASAPGVFTYSPAAGSLLHAGWNTLTATFTPADPTTYTAATTSTRIRITKAGALISWPTPVPISAGTPISATQLNATASVPGAFTYSPAAGTVLPPGITTLHGIFTPTDSSDYAVRNVTVTLTVNAPVN